jgi:hypothetical protein
MEDVHDATKLHILRALKRHRRHQGTNTEIVFIDPQEFNEVTE